MFNIGNIATFQGIPKALNEPMATEEIRKFFRLKKQITRRRRNMRRIAEVWNRNPG